MFRSRTCCIVVLLMIVIATYARAGYAQIRTRPAPTTQKPSVPPPAAPAPATPAPVAAPSKPGAPAVMAEVTRVSTSTLPTISYGTPQPRDLAAVAAVAQVSAALGGGTVGKVEPRLVTTLVAGQNVTGKILHLRGLSDIEKADPADLPEGAKRLLSLHVGKIAAAESDHYIVNTELAEEWFKTYGPLPDHIQPPEKKSKSKGCSWRHISVKCAQNEAQQALDKTSDEWENLRREAEDRWNSFSGDLSEWVKEATGCFADKTLSLNEIPVQFSIAPSMSIPLYVPSEQGSSGPVEVNGNVGLAFSMQGDFSAQLDLFYIPCLPFVIRPKQLAADGAMTVGERLTASVSATGSFDHTFTIGPGGEQSIPIYGIPIVIAGVPVAELDISAYIEGRLQVGGQGKAEASFQLDNSNTAQFDFACSGRGCEHSKSPKGIPTQTTTLSESAGIQGHVFVRPAIYTALELNFFGALTARGGLEPYVLGSVSGCAEAAAQQTAGAGSKSHESHVLSADLDWGIDLRAQALVAGEIVGGTQRTSLTGGNRHIWFRDLAPGGSTGLVAVVEGAQQVVAAQSATYRVKMPSCYPYTDPVRYRVTWTGDATPTVSAAASTTSPGGLTRVGRPMAATTPGCEWQAGEGTCNFDPKQDLVFDLTWPAAGNYTLTVAVIGDDHGQGLRRFDPEPKPTQLEITVDEAGTR
jgi:hypothetical protein